jgi:nucleotide-binding universal stress UspA family protein
MRMKILVAVDRDEESQMALRYTCHLLEHFDAHVDALYVKPDVVEAGAEGAYAPFTTPQDFHAAMEAEAQRALEEIIETCEVCLGAKIPCEPRVAVGDPAEEILRVAEEGDYDMVVLGSRGGSSFKGLLLGAVHARILHDACRPVLILRNFRPVRKILVAYRGSECDEGALKFLGRLFQKKRPEITIMHVQETKTAESEEEARQCLEEAERIIRGLGFSPVLMTARGDFVDEVLKAVTVNRFDLIVLGAHWQKRPKYLAMISDEALDLVRLTNRPVLVFREASDEPLFPREGHGIQKE